MSSVISDGIGAHDFAASFPTLQPMNHKNHQGYQQKTVTMVVAMMMWILNSIMVLLLSKCFTPSSVISVYARSNTSSDLCRIQQHQDHHHHNHNFFSIGYPDK